jgi:hypothetical protein
VYLAEGVVDLYIEVIGKRLRVFAEVHQRKILAGDVELLCEAHGIEGGVYFYEKCKENEGERDCHK